MGKFFGFVVILLGGLIAAFALPDSLSTTLPLSATATPKTPVQAAAVEAVPTPQPAIAERRRQELKSAPRNSPTLAPASNQLPTIQVQKAQTDTPPVTTAEQANPITTSSTQTKTKPSTTETALKTPVAVRTATASEPDPRVRAELTRSIQVHLQRVGCYSGPVNGQWTDASQQAMKDFNTQVNASLPVTQPDHVLLALVEGYKDKACGRSCLPGEHKNATGRCVRFEAATTVVDTPAVRKAARQKQEPVIAAPETKTTVAIAEPWRTTTVKKPRDARSQSPSEPVQVVRPAPVVTAPSIVATTRKELNQAKEAEKQIATAPPATPPMGLGIKPPPVTEAVPVSPPPPPLAVPKPAEPKLAEPETRPTVPPRQLAAVPRLEVEPQVSTPAPPRAAPVVRKAAVNTPSDARYVRRIATPPPPVVLRSYTATSYTSYMRSGAIWKKHQLEGR